jgi:hypothetical protein
MVTTFLPYVSFEKSLSVLDNQRLGKQRVEAGQIIKSIQNMYDGIPSGYINHPATRMWIGYEDALIYYYNLCLREWERRGYTNNMPYIELRVDPSDIEMPWYIGCIHFHKSHQASLVRKHPAYYTERFRQCINSREKISHIDGYLEDEYLQRGYVWPSHHEDNIEYILSIDDIHTLDTYTTGGKPFFAQINPDTMKNASTSKKKLYTVPALKQMAKDRGIKGYYKMKKDELLHILNIDIS